MWYINIAKARRNVMTEIEKYKKAWKEFCEKMAVLRKKQSEILARINRKLDEQKIEIIRKKLKK